MKAIKLLVHHVQMVFREYSLYPFRKVIDKLYAILEFAIKKGFEFKEAIKVYRMFELF